MASHKHTVSISGTSQLSFFSDIEFWRAIPGFEGLYEVSTHGRVRSLQSRYKASKYNHVYGHARILSPRICRRYYTVPLSKDGKRYPRRIHHLVLEAFVGPRPSGHVCNHKDGNALNNVLSNLEWVTWQRNAEDSVERGTKFILSGEAHHWTRFTVPQIHVIRQLAADGLSYGEIARLFSTDTRNISRIVRRINWKHIP